MTGPARTVFLGTGPFAVPVADALRRTDSADVRAVVTAPPRPAGRGGGERPSPVASWAAQHGIPILTPARLRDPASVEAIRRSDPELLVLADYGRLVPTELLDTPTHGALNLHPSLLPRHRGASPIPAAIMAGDRETGVTLMRMDAGLDTGPVVARRPFPLRGDETAPDLEARLADLAADLLVESLPAWLDGELGAVPQTELGASMTRPLRREDGRLDPARPATELERRVRALQPWPGTFLEAGSDRLVVWAADVLPAGSREPSPGSLVRVGDGVALVTADGWLALRELQPAGGRRMTGAELVRGRPSLAGSRVQGGRVG